MLSSVLLKETFYFPGNKFLMSRSLMIIEAKEFFSDSLTSLYISLRSVPFTFAKSCNVVVSGDNYPQLGDSRHAHCPVFTWKYLLRCPCAHFNFELFIHLTVGNHLVLYHDRNVLDLILT